MILIIDLKAIAIPCSNKKKNDIGMNALRIYRAGRPPASGDVSPTLKEISTKFSEEIIRIIQKGIKKNSVPNKLIHACFFSENLE
jgi:hypothetical protein